MLADANCRLVNAVVVVNACHSRLQRAKTRRQVTWTSVRSHSSPFAQSTHDTRCWLHAGQSWLMTSAGLPPRGRAGTHSRCESYCDASADGCVDTERMPVKAFVAKSLHKSHVVRRPRVHGDDPTATWRDRESAPDRALSEGQARWCARQALQL